jgi:hypothetical protein
MGARETSLVISKKKDIATCTYRYKHHSILQTTPYLFRQVNVHKWHEKVRISNV